MSLKTLLYPPRCPFCGKIMEREVPCEECLRNATELTATVCNRCGAYPEDCSCGRWIYSFRRNVSCYIYEKSPRNLLLRFKLRNRPQLTRFISNRMYYHIQARLGSDFSCITYVPQHRLKDLSRRYHPTRILAEDLAERLGLECKSTLARKLSRQQKYMKGAMARWNHAKKIYRLRPEVQLSGKVLLIDDLFTTGATLNACAELLKKAGAEEVVCATFAIKVKKS